jgi:hypothetical protein
MIRLTLFLTIRIIYYIVLFFFINNTLITKGKKEKQN